MTAKLQNAPTQIPATAETRPDAPTMERTPDGLSIWERDRIRRRARALWWEEGCPRWRSRAHWEQAQLQVLKGYGLS